MTDQLPRLIPQPDRRKMPRDCDPLTAAYGRVQVALRTLHATPEYQRLKLAEAQLRYQLAEAGYSRRKQS